MDKSDLVKIKENLQTQLLEIEGLQSVYCRPGEVKVDSDVLNDIKNFISNNSLDLPQSIDLVLTFTIERLKFQICVFLPHSYPHTSPEISIRSHELSRNQHVRINNDLREYLSSLEKGETCVVWAINWLIENAYEYADDVMEDASLGNSKKKEKYIRYWIYSHHIYGKKLKEIIDLAHQMHIRGFCMPGKPGIICIEGTYIDCNEYFQTIKSMNWKKILCKVTEEDNEDLGEAFLKFNKFTEVVFSNSGANYNHMDKGELVKYLEAHQLGYIFKEIFGVETKPKATPKQHVDLSLER